MTYNQPDFERNQIVEPFSVEDVPWVTWQQGERFGSRMRHLGKFGGGSHIGIVMEELSPGKQSAPSHYHMLEEEHLFVLKGQMLLRLGENVYDISAGDYVCFPASRAVAHALINNGSSTCRYLIIGERNPNDVIVYPESGKVKIRLTGETYQKEAVDYWDGETTSCRKE